MRRATKSSSLENAGDDGLVDGPRVAHGGVWATVPSTARAGNSIDVEGGAFASGTEVPRPTKVAAEGGKRTYRFVEQRGVAGVTRGHRNKETGGAQGRGVAVGRRAAFLG